MSHQVQEFIINPNTGRRIQVGSAVYRRLIRDGVIENKMRNHFSEEEYKRHLLRREAGMDTAGEYDGVSEPARRTKKRISTADTTDGVLDASARVFNKYREYFTDDMTEREMSELLRRLTIKELVKPNPAQSGLYRVADSRVRRPSGLAVGRRASFDNSETSDDEESDESDEE